MARFDVYRNDGRSSHSTPFLVDVQNNYLDGLATRVVVPLIRVDVFPRAELPVDLTPVFEIMGIRCLLHPPSIGALRVSELGELVGSLGGAGSSIITALDRLVGGF